MGESALADIGHFVYNVMRSRGETAATRADLAPMDPLAIEHEGERGEDEPPIGHQVSTGENPASEITGPEQTTDIMGMFRTISRDLRRHASTEAADLLDVILRTNSFDDRELATELGWTRKKLRNVPIGEAAEALCRKYAVLNLLSQGNFLPTRQSKSLASIYEKFESLRG